MTEFKLPSSRCRECPLYSRLPFHVPATGPDNAEIVSVGEAPGETEVARRTPFVGPSGQVHDRLLLKGGIERSKIKVTNVLKCRPKDNKLPEDLDLAIDCCHEILEEDIKNAKVVLGWGNIPLKAFTGLSGITRRRGSIYRLNEKQVFIGTIHPSALRRSEFVKREDDKDTKITPKEIVVADVKRAKALAAGMKWEVPENYILYPNQKEFEEFLRDLEKPGVRVGVDIESTKDQPIRAIPIIVSFSLLDRTLCASFEDDLTFIQMALQSPAEKVYHAGCFDTLVKMNVGLKIGNYFMDTLYSHHLMYAELPHSLWFVQSLYTTLAYHKHLKDEFEDIWDK